MLGYVRRFRPKLVICENVSGLLKRALGCDAQLHQVRKAFEEVGYAFAYKLVDARNFLVPARLDVGSSVGLSGRSSGWRGAGRP